MKTRTIFGILFSLILMGVIFLQFIVMFGIILYKAEAGLPLVQSIGVIEFNGAIFNSKKLMIPLDKFEESDLIKCVILKINSPGGAVAPSQEIYDRIKRYKKPVVVYIDGLGASGAYYISAAADKIVAQRGAVTGSIGVIFQTTVLKGIMEKAGVKMNVIKSGKLKDAGTFTRDMTEDEKNYFQGVIDEIYSQFVTDVAFGRKTVWLKKYPQLGKVSKDRFAAEFKKIMKKYLDGRVFTGVEAEKAGFIDIVGNFHDAVTIAKHMVGIKGKPNLNYYRYPDSRGLKLFSKIFPISNSITNSFNDGFYYMLKW